MDPERGIMKGKVNIILAVVAMSFTQGLQYFVSPVMEEIADYYRGIDLSLVQMLITIPAFVSVFASIVIGGLVTRISKKKIILFACGLAGVVGLIPLISGSFYLLFICRALYGVSIGVLAALNTAVVAEFFDGSARVRAMGIQGASIGAGLLIINMVSGILGGSGFKYTYYINLLGFLAMVVVAIFLPDTGMDQRKKKEKIRLNSDVAEICLFAFLAYIFLVTYSTNIAMHISGGGAGDSAVSGVMTGIYSVAQIFIGLVLGSITKVAKKYVLAISMFGFCIGAVILVLFPNNYVMLITASLLCGFAQGIYVPSAFVEISNSVPPIAVALASSAYNAAGCFGQTLSPYILNTGAKMMFGKMTTTGVFILAALGMGSTGIVFVIRRRKKDVAPCKI